jgi:hypothetical protein
VSVGTIRRDLGGRDPSLDRGLARAVRSQPTLAVGGLTLLAALLRFTRIGHQGFWFDEANTALLVHFSPGKMLGLIPKSESTPPLYYCLAWVWARIFGYGEAGLRSLSALAGVAAVPVAYGAGRKLISERAGLIAAALTACNPLLIWYSQEARSYSLLVLLTGGSLLAFAHVHAEPTPRAVLAWVVVSALALATHYYAVLAVIPEAGWLLAVHRRRRPVQIGVGVVGVCGLALIPLALHQGSSGLANWIGSAPLHRRLGPMFGQFVLGFGSPGYALLEPLAVVIAAGAVVLLGARATGDERRGGLIAGGIALAGLVINLLLIFVGIDDLIARNALGIWMPAAVAVAGGLAARRAQPLGLLLAAVLCALGIAAAVAVTTDRNLQRPDWRVVASDLGRQPPPAQPGEQGRAILIQHYRDLLPLSLYMPKLALMPRHGADVSELDVVSFSSPPSGGFCWWGSACNLWPSKVQSSYPVPGFRELWRRRALQFTIVRLVAPAGARLTARDVGQILRTTHLRNDELLLQRY